MIGIFVAEILPVSPEAVLSVAFVMAGCAAFFLWRPGLMSTYALVGCGFFLLHDIQTTGTPGLRLAALLGESSRVATATGGIVTEPKMGPNGYATFLMKLNELQLDHELVSSDATIFVRWRGRPSFGDQLKLFGVIEPVAPPRNPGQFDMRAYLARLDVRRALFVRYPENSVLLGHRGGNPVLRAAQASREWMQRALCRGLEDSPDVQSFLSGIVLGLRHQTPEDIEDPFQQTGTLHLFAVAGLHVGIVARLLWVLAMVMQLSRKWAAAMIIPCLLFYAAVTGLHVSSVRAAVMAAIMLGGLFFERRVFALNSLAAAAFILLSWNTNELFATGFQLSFAVVGAIVLLSDPLSSLAERRLAPDPFLPKSLIRAPQKLLSGGVMAVARGVSVSGAAWIGSLVLILWYFYLVAPISLVANLVVVPVAFFVLAIALIALITAPITPWVSVVFNNANWLLAQFVLGIVHLFAQVPGGHYYLAHPRWPDGATVTMNVLDLGAGGAIHVQTGGQDWLFDCGSDRDYERTVREYLRASGINRLHGVSLSHGDAQHIGAIPRIVSEYRPTVLTDNPAPDRSALHRRLRATLKRGSSFPRDVRAGDEIALSSNGVTVRVLYPPPGFSAPIADDQALVVQLTTPSATVLLMSDSGELTERSLLAANLDLRSDIIVKGKHHSSYGYSDSFLDAVNPKLIVATSRDFPISEHLSDEWAERVRGCGITLFRQDETGAVELRFRANDWQARAYTTGEIFRSSSR